MRKLIYALGGLLYSIAAVSASDLPLKAPKQQFIGAYPYGASGWYVDVGTFGEATKITVSAPAAVGTSGFAAGGSVTIGGGYAYTLSANRWLAVEGSLNYADTSAEQAGVAIANRISGTQRLMYGGSMDMLTQWFPSLANLSTVLPVLPPLPAGASNPLSHPYIAAVIHESRNQVSMGLLSDRAVRLTYGGGMGVITQLSNGSALDTWVEATSSSGVHLLGPVTESTGVTYRAGATMKWGVGN